MAIRRESAIYQFDAGIKTDTISEVTADVGVTIDSVLHKDGCVCAPERVYAGCNVVAGRHMCACGNCGITGCHPSGVCFSGGLVTYCWGSGSGAGLWGDVGTWACLCGASVSCGACLCGCFVNKGKKIQACCHICAGCNVRAGYCFVTCGKVKACCVCASPNGGYFVSSYRGCSSCISVSGGNTYICTCAGIVIYVS